MARRIGEKRLHIKGLIAGPKADRAIGYLPPAKRPKSSYVRSKRPCRTSAGQADFTH